MGGKEYNNINDGARAVREAVLLWEQSHSEEKSLILIAGPSAAGKDKFFEKLGFDEGTLHLSLDRYYLDADQVKSTLGTLNFSVPEALDQVRIKEDVRKILLAEEGHMVSVPIYDMRQSKKVGEEKIIVQRRIIVQGVYTFILVSVDTPFRVFIDANISTRLQRKINRDTKERNIPEDIVRERFEKNARPAVEQYVMPQKEKATIVVHNNMSPPA